MGFNLINILLEVLKNDVDWLNTLAVVVVGIITTLVSLKIADNNAKEQRKLFKMQTQEQKRQWYYKYYIERESNILIEFRNKLYRLEKAVFWFSDILKPYKIYGKIYPTQDVKQSEENLIVKFKTYCKYYDEINDLNNFYNDNQLILRKHGICDQMMYFTAILSTMDWLKSNDDFRYDFVDESDTQVRYKLDVIDQIGTLFINSIDFEKIQNIDNIDLSYSEEKLEKYSNDIMSIYIALKLKLDEMTTFFENDIPVELNSRKIKYFPSSAQLIKSIKDRS